MRDLGWSSSRDEILIFFPEVSSPAARMLEFLNVVIYIHVAIYIPAYCVRAHTYTTYVSVSVEENIDVVAHFIHALFLLPKNLRKNFFCTFSRFTFKFSGAVIFLTFRTVDSVHHFFFS